MSAENISIFVAFLAGLLSFLSPCVLPLVPGYIGHLVGVTSPASNRYDTKLVIVSSTGAATRHGSGKVRAIALTHALVFVLGFSLVFITFWASLSIIGHLLPGYIRYVRPVGGVILIILGLNMAGLFRLSFLQRTFKLGQTSPSSHQPGLPASFFTGVVFAAGWTPCIGPVLGSIIGLAGESSTALEGTFLLVAYSLGLGIPFIGCALLLGQANGLLRWLNRSLNRTRFVSILSGLLVALIGVLMLTNLFQTLPQYFNWMAL